MCLDEASEVVEAPVCLDEEVEEEVETETLGGWVYTMDWEDATLRWVSQDAYGHEHYWEQVRDHNLGASVFVDGDTNYFVWGARITAPELDIPTEGPTTNVPSGGEESPFRLEHDVESEATFCIWPDGWAGPMQGGQPGAVHVRASELVAEKRELRQQAADQRRTVALTVNGLGDVEEIDEADAEVAFRALCALPVTEINAGIRSMHNGRWERIQGLLTDKPELTESYARFVAGMRKKVDGSKPTNDELALYFDLVSDSDVYALQRLMSQRFDFEVGGRDGGAWTADGLRRAWALLERLPPEHVEDNHSLDLLLRDNSEAGSGYYASSDQSAVLGYGEDLEEVGSYGEVMVDGEDVGLHSSVNLFDTVLRHEIGHAVDEKVGVSTGYAATTDSAGAWQVYHSADAFVDAVIAASESGMDIYPDPEAYEQALKHAISNTMDFDEALAALRDSGAIDEDVPDYEQCQDGPVDALLTTDLWSEDSSPWYMNPSRPGVGGRRWQEAYSGEFVSYVAEAYESNAVSAYQFRAPYEWFAEAYACFYSDHPEVNGNEVGSSLQGRDSATYAYIKNNIDNGHSFPQEVPEATQGGTTTDTSDGLQSAPS